MVETTDNSLHPDVAHTLVGETEITIGYVIANCVECRKPWECITGGTDLMVGGGGGGMRKALRARIMN